MPLIAAETETLLLSAAVLNPGGSQDIDFEFTDPPSTLGFVFTSTSDKVLLDLKASMLLAGYSAQILKDINVNNGFPILLLKTYKKFRATVHLSSNAPTSETVSLWVIGSNHSFGSAITIANFPSVQPISDNGSSLTVDGSVGISNFPATQPVSIASTIRSLSPIPADTDVVSGSVLVNNSVTQTTVITVPAGRTWLGSLTGYVYASGTAAATQANAQIRTLGTAAIPAPGTIIGYMLTHLSGVASDTAPYTFNKVIVKAPVGNSVTITVTNSTATALVSVVTANGVLL